MSSLLRSLPFQTPAVFIAREPLRILSDAVVLQIIIGHYHETLAYWACFPGQVRGTFYTPVEVTDAQSREANCRRCVGVRRIDARSSTQLRFGS